MEINKQTVTVDVFGLIKFVKTNIVRNVNEYKANKNGYGYGYDIFQILDYGGHCTYEAYYILKHVLNNLTTISAEIKYKYVVFDNIQIKAEFDNVIKEACSRWTRREQYQIQLLFVYCQIPHICILFRLK
jgi:hypothetical protein